MHDRKPRATLVALQHPTVAIYLLAPQDPFSARVPAPKTHQRRSGRPGGASAVTLPLGLNPV